ncbi:MAG: prephenate dehydrogenase/arogenate dehydrogenase family protein [Sterolibacteriaceae bacterium]|jgi:prephenate dehydrogenase|uniref:prephenate dehydrogenase n=1 Tax=Candidatus Methylophosphatis roskildensis TaxID=2899263 RepID=A0A9D7E690_9PROT|nr:prephenate dehydrogenase/arogenate dehydrogenase family protein [Candidatus Methylophosphatis roskildensis]MBK7665405.1 prephenate dehydrogenase/arogenate dehydrogenase family protein [Sterolibacteriaceae bacterium]MBK9085654.1 prephenate dehydrogenase/arogenate dehydrogenase family protein [Sterolibacteriaceae bacterium]
MRPISKLVVCGVGLIGGSAALALRAAGAVDRVVGIGRSRATLDAAQRLGVIDEIAVDWSRALPGAEVVLIAAPVGQMEAISAAMAPFLDPDTIVTDAGSTKRDVVATLRCNLAPHLASVVPAHPIAGAENSGVDAALATLYRDRRVVVTPLPESSPAAIARVFELWRACGALVSSMSPEEHDRVFAAVSHLPHLLAFALVHEFAARDDADRLFGFAAGGFRDFTRIASSHPEMWRDICVANRQALIGELDAYTTELARLRALLVDGNGTALEATFDRARNTRNDWLAGKLPGAQ